MRGLRGLARSVQGVAFHARLSGRTASWSGPVEITKFALAEHLGSHELVVYLRAPDCPLAPDTPWPAIPDTALAPGKDPIAAAAAVVAQIETGGSLRFRDQPEVSCVCGETVDTPYCTACGAHRMLASGRSCVVRGTACSGDPYCSWCGRERPVVSGPGRLGLVG